MKNKYYVAFTDEDKHSIITCLIDKRNELISQGKYTDGIDELLIKFGKCKKRKFNIVG
ncbi:MAG: hypothetical protein IKE65_02630 [Clostridia bacterium]|nr:hypothetical protein [Clostridia bacterium]